MKSPNIPDDFFFVSIDHSRMVYNVQSRSTLSMHLSLPKCQFASDVG